jgi:predicted adenine nucleotide alpha hydrolase (AANH) superfamily ATPase
MREGHENYKMKICGCSFRVLRQQARKKEKRKETSANNIVTDGLGLSRHTVLRVHRHNII